MVIGIAWYIGRENCQYSKSSWRDRESYYEENGQDGQRVHPGHLMPQERNDPS
jgi:hypothetical protein